MTRIELSDELHREVRREIVQRAFGQSAVYGPQMMLIQYICIPDRNIHVMLKECTPPRLVLAVEPWVNRPTIRRVNTATVRVVR